MSMERLRFLALGAGCVLTVTACRSPFDPVVRTDDLQQSIRAAIEREFETLPEEEQQFEMRVEPSATERALAERRDELEAITPAWRERPRAEEFGADLTGQSQQDVTLSFEQAVQSAVRHNLATQIARLQPAITLQDVLSAEAAFDFVLFANTDFTHIDEQTTVPVINGIPLGRPLQRSETWRFETGVRADLITGGFASLSTDLSRTDFRTPGIAFAPDPAYEAAIRLGFSQPLLRNFGSDIAQTTIFLTRNIQRRAVEQLRIDLLDVIAQTEVAYWNLVFAWQDLQIRQWLVEEGIEVRDVLERRRDFDARPAEYADAVARVEQRQADVIRARREVHAASDALKQLINDPQLPVGSEAVIFPSDFPAGQQIQYNLVDAMRTALGNRPELEQARLQIDDAVIQQRFAANALLPRLDLFGQVDFTGLDGSSTGAYGEIAEGFINFVLGANFEWPIGNRAAEAGFRQARLQRSAALLRYRQAVQQVVLDVKDALRDVLTNYELIQATRSFRVAQAENLRALRVREALVGLTPEFLNLVFQRQETLALARQQEMLALVNFDQALARLYRALGTGMRMHGIAFEPFLAVDEENGIRAGYAADR